MYVTDRQMWIAALAGCVALIGLALAPWLEGGFHQEVLGTELPLLLGFSRAELMIAGAIAMAAISLVAICRPDIEQHVPLVLSLIALGAFTLCASTISADWRVDGCGVLRGPGLDDGSRCFSGGVRAFAPTLPLWIATGLSAFLVLWFSASWFRLHRSSSKVDEASNGWA